jgi:hypothetical protein
MQLTLTMTVSVIDSSQQLTRRTVHDVELVAFTDLVQDSHRRIAPGSYSIECVPAAFTLPVMFTSFLWLQTQSPTHPLALRLPMAIYISPPNPGVCALPIIARRHPLSSRIGN